MSADSTSVRYFTCLAGMALSLAAQAGDDRGVISEAELADFNRTTHCVYGALPMEVHFSVVGNPPHLASLDNDELTKLTKKIDGSIARLLTLAMQNAWGKVNSEPPSAWSNMFFEKLATEFEYSIVKNAPKLLGIEFCGGGDTVGNTTFAAIVAYIDRSIRAEDGSVPNWLKPGGKSSGQETSIVFIAVGLQLAGIDFDQNTLILAGSVQST